MSCFSSLGINCPILTDIIESETDFEIKYSATSIRNEMVSYMYIIYTP